MKAVFKACIWGYLPEASIPFTASKNECQPSKETKLQLPFPLLCVCFLLACLFQRKNAMKCGYNQSNMKHKITEIQNGSSSTSGNFFLLAHPEDGLNICLSSSVGLFSVSMAFPKYQIVYFQWHQQIHSGPLDAPHPVPHSIFLYRGTTLLPLWESSVRYRHLRGLEHRLGNLYFLHRCSRN